MSVSSQEEVFRQQDRKRLQERQHLEQASFPELRSIARANGVPCPDNANRFVVVDAILKKTEAAARKTQEDLRSKTRQQKEAQKDADIREARDRAARERSNETGMTKAAAEALERRIAKAKQTRRLDLSNSPDGRRSQFALTDVPTAALTAFRVSARGRGSELASSASSKQGLTELWLSHNQLEGVNPELRQIKTLEVLCLSGNRLRQIPAFLGGLKKLRRLLITHNQIEDVPEQLQNLKCVVVPL
jgi:Leucine-rich repeat (LRR) protein